MTNNSALASGHGGSDAKEEAPSITNKSRLLLSTLRKGDYAHAGGIEAVHLVTEKALKIFPDITDGNTLDIGCGFGGTANFLQKEGFNQIWGIDIDKAAIEHSRQHYPNVQFAVADATKLTDIFEDEFFSFVYMFNVAYAIPDKAAMLQKIKAICKKDAILAIFDYTLDDPEHSEFITDLAGAKMNPLNLNEFKILLRILGWELIETTNITEKYKKWYTKILAKIDTQQDMLIASGYSQEEIKLVQDTFSHMLTLMNENKLGGTILFAKKV